MAGPQSPQGMCPVLVQPWDHSQGVLQLVTSAGAALGALNRLEKLPKIQCVDFRAINPPQDLVDHNQGLGDGRENVVCPRVPEAAGGKARPTFQPAQLLAH